MLLICVVVVGLAEDKAELTEETLLRMLSADLKAGSDLRGGGLSDLEGHFGSDFPRGVMLSGVGCSAHIRFSSIGRVMDRRNVSWMKIVRMS